MKKMFQFRISPTKNQEVALNRTLSTCRHLYNDSLGERKRQSELNELERTFGVTPWGKPDGLNYYDQANSLSGSKTDFQKDVFSQVLQNVLKRVERSFKNFFSGFLVSEYDRIVFEDLQVQNMVKNHHLAKSISDAGWSQLINFTKTKAEYAGKIVELVNPRNTSQNCSGCGNSVKKDLSVRIHSCPFCGLELDRDHNAAINILKRSNSTVGTTGFQACLSNLSREAMKQEAHSPFRRE